MIKNCIEKSPAALYASALLLAIALMEYLAIVYLNHGVFIFSLDDPYIHLALAENIAKGHYGVNVQEFSAPSSSIIWPFIIAPFTLFANTGSLLLLFNVALSLGSLWLFNAFLSQVDLLRAGQLSNKQRFALLAAFIVFANLIGLAFIGMEHNLQLLLVLGVLHGLVIFINSQRAPAWLYACIVLLPLIRYETLVISGAALLFLFSQRYYWQSVISGAAIVLLLLTFSAFLLSLGLGYLPDSVLAKSDVAASGLVKLWQNFITNLYTRSPPLPKGLLLLMGAAYLLWQSFKQSHAQLRILLQVMVLAIVMHLIGGRIGWLWRYEIYVWMILLSLLIMLSLVQHKRSHRWFLGVFLFFSAEHLLPIALTPAASSNTYLHQYQMHRLITDFYKKPVAVNDLGLTTFKNPYYVLDLWGLGSSQAREMRKGSNNSDWMAPLVAAHEIDLVMVFHDPRWFKQLPEDWINLGTLKSNRMSITALPVSFFTPCAECVDDLETVLTDFGDSLPEGVKFYKNE